MTRINTIFAELRSQGRKALMPFVVGGHPVRLPGLLGGLERGGASIVEVGIPFSDPIADGPVIAAAMHKALVAGVTPEGVFSQVREARDGGCGVGLVAMVSVSIVHRCGGPAGFSQRAAAAGFDGLIVPDVPLEESGPVREAAAAAGLCCSLLVAPTTPPKRAEAIAQACTGFVYLLARSGVTGEQQQSPDVAGPVERLRAVADLPIAVGFGISTPGHVRDVVRHADAAIVGSAMVRRLEEAGAAGEDVPQAAERFATHLTQGL
ncbi:MAG: tryptophan synthase subunit alpha [Phycisphaeraceae bacterium]|nr:tryptophan synthase subunit alpha [Phycisphaeraceae bacterium]